MGSRGQEWIDRAAATLAATPEPSHLKAIARAARHADDDELEVALLIHGREALEAAALAAHRAAILHVREQRDQRRFDELRVALAAASGAADRIAELSNLTPAGSLAPEFASAARHQLATMKPPAVKRRGSPGRPVQRAAAIAAAEVWAQGERRAIPTGGVKAADHPLAVLLRAVSADLFGHPGALTAEYLRAGRK
jgi:hypothetical protein